MAATHKEKRKEHKKMATHERKFNKEVLLKHGGIRKAHEKSAVKRAKKVTAVKNFHKTVKSMY